MYSQCAASDLEAREEKLAQLAQRQSDAIQDRLARRSLLPETADSLRQKKAQMNFNGKLECREVSR